MLHYCNIYIFIEKTFFIKYATVVGRSRYNLENEMKILSLAIFASVFSTGAYAGGYVAPEITVDPIVPSASSADWTGFYAGLQYGVGDADLSFSGLSEGEDIDAFGFHVGYMRDLGQFVVGGEFVYDRIGFDSDDDAAGNLGRLQGRLGYDGGRFMPYVTLGIAALTDDSDDISESGFTYGVGAEFLVSEQFSLGAEYTRSSFSDVLEDETGISGLDLDADLIQVRASFRF